LTVAKDMDPKGKVALITGGARIGQVVAGRLAAHRCDLALAYRGSHEAGRVAKWRDLLLT